ncbi:hypothetical protein [Shewanella sp. 125m-1]
MEFFQKQLKRFEQFETRVSLLEKKYESIEANSEDRWMTLIEASCRIPGKTPDAIRQRMTSKTKPMPQGIVWKQEAKGHEYLVNLKSYREYM